MLKVLIRTFLPSSLWTRLRLIRLWCSIRFYRARVVRHDYCTYPLVLYVADPMGAGWYDHDWPQLAEIELLKLGRLKPSARVFDLGAHQCVVALILAKTVGTDGFVLALEPHLHNVAVGERNRELNDVKQLRIVHGAVTTTSGMIAMNKGLNSQVEDGSHEWGSMQVPSFSIDDLSMKYGTPDVLFIDVEGFECRALSGAADTLKSRPDCFVEVHLGEGLEKFGSVAELLSFFSRENYRLFVRTEAEEHFAELRDESELPRERFFMVALNRWTQAERPD